MPLDLVLTADDFVPDNINFKVDFEPTKFKDKKYVINADTDEYLGVVGNDFNCVSHGEFFEGVHQAVTEHLGEDDCADMNIRWRDARNGAWAMLDMTLPNVTANIVTDTHTTRVAQRIIALHGIDGSCSNQVFFGAIDFFCTNGMIRGDHDKVRRKNTSGFNMDRFIRDLSNSTQHFYDRTQQLQEWASHKVQAPNVKAMLDKLFSSERKADKMWRLYQQEVHVRGHNLWSVYSAFTNYASYADSRNGFTLRNTGNDTEAVSMFSREQEVAQWIESKPFKKLANAA